MNFLWTKLLRQKPSCAAASGCTSTTRPQAVASSAGNSISSDAVVGAELIGLAMAMAVSAAVVG